MPVNITNYLHIDRILLQLLPVLQLDLLKNHEFTRPFMHLLQVYVCKCICTPIGNFNIPETRSCVTNLMFVPLDLVWNMKMISSTSTSVNLMNFFIFFTHFCTCFSFKGFSIFAPKLQPIHDPSRRKSRQLLVLFPKSGSILEEIFIKDFSSSAEICHLHESKK